MLNTTSAYGYDGYFARKYPVVAVSLGFGWSLRPCFVSGHSKVVLVMIATKPGGYFY